MRMAEFRFCDEGHAIEAGTAQLLVDWGELSEPLHSQVRYVAEQEVEHGPICPRCTKRKGQIVRAKRA